MIVLIRGPLLSVTGYGNHARQVWRWARSKPGWDVYANIVPWGQCTYYISEEEEDGIIGDVMARSDINQMPRKPDLSLQIQLPDEWDAELATKNIGITAGIEADRCNQSWIAACAKMDKVVVPSEFSKLSFLNGGLAPASIVSVPEAITCGTESTDEVEELNHRLDNLSTNFNFLMFGQLTNPDPSCDRKNTTNCIKWLCETFSGDKDIGIVIKTNLGRMTCEDRNTAASILGSMVKSIRKGPYPRIHLVHGLLDKNEIGALYTHDKIKALVAPTRGEGWGLPLLDAASSGLPVIATGCTGHVDFLKHVKYLDVKYSTVPIPNQMADGRIWVPGARWAEPEENHFKHRVKKFRANSKLPTEWAHEAKEKLQEKFSIEAIMQHYDAALGDVL